MITKSHLQRLAGFSVATLIMVAVATYIYLDHLDKKTAKDSWDQQSGPVMTAEQQPLLEPLQEKMSALFHQDAYYFSINDAKLYLDSYYSYPLLFSLPTKHRSTLDREQLSDEVRQIFRAQSVSLSQKAEVAVAERGLLWSVTDRKGNLDWLLKYTIALEDEQLNVYRDPREFKGHQLQIDFATLYPGQYGTGDQDWSPMPWEELLRLYNEYSENHSDEFQKLRFRLADKDRLRRR